MKPSHRKTLLVVAKFILAAALLYWALRGTDWAKMLLALKTASWLTLCMAAMFTLVGTLICAVRLRILLQSQEIDVGLWEITRLTFLGQFYNNVIPGSVGGDLVKAFYLAKHTSHKARVLLAVFVDRVLGLAALAIMAAALVLISLWAGLGSWENIRSGVISVVIMVAAILVTGTFILSSRFRRLFHLQKIYGRLSFAHHFQAAGEGTRLLRQHPGYLLQAVGVTLVSQTFWIGSIWLTGRALSIEGLSWYHYFLYVPLVYVIGAVPVTPGGLGFIEKLYVLFLGPSGVGADKTLVGLLALLARGVQLFWALPGIIVSVQGAKVPRPDAMEAELALDESPA
ncbi:MAG: flippase-like domain-containing protein [Planctomycetaceae bacterium]|nr:flippase-like domain-containing protein [Planctomycetaceae bacterium]